MQLARAMGQTVSGLAAPGSRGAAKVARQQMLGRCEQYALCFRQQSSATFLTCTLPLPACSYAAAGPRPDRLRAEVARQAMPSAVAGGGRIGAGGTHGPARGLEVVAAHYSNGVLLLAEAAPGESRTRLFMLSR